MASPNISELLTTTLHHRMKPIRDSFTLNNALFAYLNKAGNVSDVSGGVSIYEPLAYQGNSNAGWYSGPDLLPVGAQDVLTSAEFTWRQAACAVTVSGLDEMQNSGEDRVFDLVAERIKVAEASMDNLMAGGQYSDGTGAGGKQIIGLKAAIPLTPTTGVYGGIDRAVWGVGTNPFWASQVLAAGAQSAATIQQSLNTLDIKCRRGKDTPDLCIMDNAFWAIFEQSMQAIQRVTEVKKGELGFLTLSYRGMDVIPDGGFGGFCPANTAFLINTKYMHMRNHKDRNMVVLNPDNNRAINQDVIVKVIVWGGAMTSSLQFCHGRLDGN